MEYIQGCLSKLRVNASAPHAEYSMMLDGVEVPLNAHIGKRIHLQFTGEIRCTACNRPTRKSYNQGYCYPCAQTLAECDLCIVSPEKCHRDHGTCRDPAWAQDHCQQDHVVYLANTSGLKVGITRVSQMPTRWLDQGATQAIPILRVRNRHHSGLVEALMREHVADRTDWRKMLKGDAEALELAGERDRLMARCEDGLVRLREAFAPGGFQPLPDAEAMSFSYPVEAYPEKVASLGFDKTPVIEGKLLGIKAQYLLLDTGVLNVRKHTGYRISLGLAA